MRYAALALLFLLGSCSSLSSEEQKQLADYQRYAKEWYDKGRLENALNVVEKGLVLDPDNYQLNTIQGAILLQRSPPAEGFDHRLLDQATKQLARMYETRSPHRHSPALIFWYAFGLQKQARRHRFEAERRAERAAAGGPQDPSGDEIAALRARADEDYAFAEELFEVLIDRGEMLRLCHKHLLGAAYERGRHEAVEQHAGKYFELAKEAIDFHVAEIAKTTVFPYEEDQKQRLQEVRNEELEVRALLAGYYAAREQPKKTLEMLDRVLELDPKRVNDYYNRGKVLLQLGRMEGAKADFKKFLTLSDLPADSDKKRFAYEVLTR